MNSKTGVAFSKVTIAAVTVLFGSGLLVANQQVQAFPLFFIFSPYIDVH
jgi:hypothetical protein